MSAVRWCEDCGSRLDGYYPREMQRCPTCIRFLADNGDREGQAHVEDGAPVLPMGEAITVKIEPVTDAELLQEYDEQDARLALWAEAGQ